VFFGLGSESLFCAQAVLITKYFWGRELSFALGFNLAIANMGGVLDMFFTPRISKDRGVTAAAWFGTSLCFVSVFSAVIVVLLDIKFEKDGHKSILKTHKYDGPQRKIAFTDLREFDKIFWYICLCSFFIFSSIISWINIGTSFIVEKWYYNEELGVAEIDAGNILCTLWLMAVISGPLLGYFVDKYGARGKLLIVASSICCLCHFLFLFMYPIIPAMLMGLAYSIGYAAIGPSIAYVSKPYLLGKANGIVASLQNLGFFICPYIIACIKILTGSYDFAQIFLIGFSAVGIKVGLLVYKENFRRGEILEKDTEHLADVKSVEILELLENKHPFKYQLLGDDDHAIGLFKHMNSSGSENEEFSSTVYTRMK